MTSIRHFPIPNAHRQRPIVVPRTLPPVACLMRDLVGIFSLDAGWMCIRRSGHFGSKIPAVIPSPRFPHCRRPSIVIFLLAFGFQSLTSTLHSSR
ncbi:hypothetical protein C8R42DRAFT_724297 [Lentinula raphanica]|nr:hypothetical protein C8R42DRAFT_724297 [Lentinula raphanica]